MVPPDRFGSGTAVNSYKGVIQQREKREGAIVQWHSFRLNTSTDLRLIHMIFFNMKIDSFFFNGKHTH